MYTYKKEQRRKCFCCSRYFYKGGSKYCYKCKLLLDKIGKGRAITREMVRIRDKHLCRDCGKKKINNRRLDVHHLNGLCGKKSRGYDSIKEIDCLITLCHKCHFNRHDRSPKIDNEQGKSGRPIYRLGELAKWKLKKVGKFEWVRVS